MPTASSGQDGYYGSETCFYVLTVMNLIENSHGTESRNSETCFYVLAVMNLIENILMGLSLGVVFPQMEAVAFIQYGALF
jgi:hypothetical protein